MAATRVVSAARLVWRYLTVPRVAALVCCVLTAMWIQAGLQHPPRQFQLSGEPAVAQVSPRIHLPKYPPPGPLAWTSPEVLTQYVDSSRLPNGWQIHSTIGLGSMLRGLAVSAWYHADPDPTTVATAVSARRGSKTVTLTAVWVDPTGHLRAHPLPTPTADVDWQQTPLGLPADATAFRLVASSPRDSPDWLMFTVPYRPTVDLAQPVRDIRRALLTLVAVLTLVLGPGFAWAAAFRRRIAVLTLALPGLATLGVIGATAWLVGWKLRPKQPDLSDPVTIARQGVILLLILLAATAILAPPKPGRWRVRWPVVAVLGVYLALVVVVTGRALWSPGPPGELYGGQTTRTYEVGSRADARLPYSGVLVVLNGADPGQTSSEQYGFGGWTFADRGPLAPAVVAPIVASSGADIQPRLRNGAWQPVDGYGYYAFRIAMGAANLIVVLVIAGLASALRGQRAGRVAAALAGTTPFLLHEGFFTWPKLLAAAFVLLAGHAALRNRPVRAGLLLALGSLTHPLALLWAPSLGLLWLWTVWRRRSPSWPRRVGWVAVGGASMVGVVVGAYTGWQKFSGRGQSDLFLSYPRRVNLQPAHSFGEWLSGRWVEVQATLVPGYLPTRLGDSPEINVRGGQSPAAIHWLEQYWTGLPFGLGLAAVPLLLWALVVLARRYPTAVAVAVLLPFLLFTAFWGAAITGMLREGLHPWLATLLVVMAVAVHDWRGHWVTRVLATLAALRVGDLAAVLLGPVVFTGGALVSAEHAGTDRAALWLIWLGIGWLGLTALASVLVDVYPRRFRREWRRVRATAEADVDEPVEPVAPATPDAVGPTPAGWPRRIWPVSPGLRT